MIKNITVGFLKSSDPNDQTSWSGISYHMLTSLRNTGLKVEVIGPVNKPIMLRLILSFINRLHLLFFNKRFNKDHNVLLSKYYARQFIKRLKNKNIDLIFAPSASIEIAYLKTSIPICYLSGTSFNQIQNYYDYYSNLSKSSIKESDLIEQKAINNSTTQVYPSKWASQHVIDYYKADDENVFVIPYGANLNFVPKKTELKNRQYTAPIKLLFLGVSWERKGGDIVFNTLKTLLEKKYDVTLTVCGCIPPVTHPKMTIIPFLDKNIDSDKKAFTQLLSESHILFVPTRAECFGIVFCEAAAFGLPVVTTNTGGVGAIIENGINGFALPLDATAEDYVNKIQFLLDSQKELKDMSFKARDKYESELNWETWACNINKVFIDTISKHSMNNKI